MNSDPKITEPATRRWLGENRQHRMDALDNSGIFAPNRQAFHRARYEFAKKYIDREFLVSEIKDFKRPFYVCGPDKMISDITGILTELGADPESVVFEK